ncbi:transcriptional regulator [Microbacterium mitrae]|uniref:Transcriptional regulator n=1 Tax=Microbacterium mitrae TaxID=664640 RepID=A0A5C8HQZ1_9MICO|nr:LysR family substrate-binding domain-containing protein [Microbacterium mitrae]TXK06434.1 transcriptional regulator [Microbacterium mitrae]
MSSARRGPAGKSGKRPLSHAKGAAGKGAVGKGTAGKGAARGAKASAARGQAGKSGTKGAGTSGAGKSGAGKNARGTTVVFDSPVAEKPGPFRLGVVAGATPGKWIAVWRERYPDIELELVPTDSAAAREALLAGGIDLAIVREPFSHDDLHVIALYEEVVGAVVSVDSALEAAAELTLADFAGEVVIVPRDDVTNFGSIAGAVEPKFAAPETTEDAIQTVATGVGVVIVPMSIARAHRRKDVTFRPIVGAEPTQVALAWERANDSAEVQAFIGIVRGRTAQSSRG